MRILRTLALSLLLCGTGIINGANSRSFLGLVNPETPAKTVIIKASPTLDLSEYFAYDTSFEFEIYKPGSKQDLEKIIKAFRKDAAVELCEMGVTTGDYQQIILKLKSKKDKVWFASIFKKAGLDSVKYNNEPLVSIDKM